MANPRIRCGDKVKIEGKFYTVWARSTGFIQGRCKDGFRSFAMTDIHNPEVIPSGCQEYRFDNGQGIYYASLVYFLSKWHMPTLTPAPIEGFLRDGAVKKLCMWDGHDYREAAKGLFRMGRYAVISKAEITDALDLPQHKLRCGSLCLNYVTTESDDDAALLRVLGHDVFGP